MQNNVKAGRKVFATTADLTGKENHLAKLINNGGAIALGLTSAVGDIAQFVIVQVNGPTEVEAMPLNPEANVRVALKGAVNPAGTLILATGADSGKLVAAATGNVNAVAEEAGADGQHVLVRPCFRVVV